MSFNSKLFVFNEISQQLELYNINYNEDFDLSNKSTMKIKSSAKLFVVPQDIEQFQNAIRICKDKNTDFFILGGGSNIIFPDNCYEGVIISTEKLNRIQIISESPLLVKCECGTPMQSLVNFCSKHEITGFEEFAGLPGSVGGALYMNSRCFDKSINENIYQTTHLDVSQRNPEIIIHNYNVAEWDYKKSPFQDNQIENPSKIILNAVFTLKKGNIQDIQKNCSLFITKRKEKGHFKFPSAGSVFKNNHAFGKPSGELIDLAGLKGYRIGGAQIAPFHGNFIINIDNAKAQDVKQLVDYIQNSIKKSFGYLLETEILFLQNHK